MAVRRILLLATLSLLTACASGVEAAANSKATEPADPSPSATIVASSTPTLAPLPSLTPEIEMMLSPNGEVVSRLDVGEKKLIALTIDDGYGRLPFDAIIELLRERDLQATFFLVAHAAINLGPERMVTLVADGHQIAYHSFSHDDLEILSRWNQDDWIVDYQNWEAAFRELLGDEVYEEVVRPYARAPYGLFNAPFLVMTEEMGLVPLGWSKAPDDLARSMALESGDIFLFHVRYPDVDLMGPIMDESGFEFVSLDELIAEANLK